MTRTIVHISNTGGHRPSYRDLFVRLLDGAPSTGPIRGRRFWRLVRAPKVFLATIDDDYAGFFAVALLRAFQRKPTAGLFLRPIQCFRRERPIVYSLKRWVFRALRRLPGLRLLSIVPFEQEPRLAKVCHGWIYDPQMWDLWIDGRPELPETELSARTELQRQGREVTIFIGKCSRIKGFPEFLEYAKRYSKDILCVVAGQVAPEYKNSIAELEEIGAIVEDRFVSDKEIHSLYRIADHAWCRYSSDYDQASGVFGRALQTGVTPIVRNGSILHAEVVRHGQNYIDARKVITARDMSLNQVAKSIGKSVSK